MFRYLLGKLYLIILLIACDDSVDKASVVARVGDAILTEDEINAHLPAGDLGVTSVVERKQFVDAWVEEELLFQEALARGYDQDVRIQYLLVQARRDLLIATLLNREFSDRDVQLGEAEIERYYYANRDQYLREQEEVKLRHILVASRRDVNAAHRALLAGDDFLSVARSYASAPDFRDSDPSAAVGALGYITREDDSELWEALVDLPIGRLSEPLKTTRGYYLVKILNRYPEGSAKEPEQVRPLIVAAIVREEQRRRMEEYMNQLKEDRASEWFVKSDKAADEP